MIKQNVLRIFYSQRKLAPLTRQSQTELLIQKDHYNYSVIVVQKSLF